MINKEAMEIIMDGYLAGYMDKEAANDGSMTASELLASAGDHGFKMPKLKMPKPPALNSHDQMYKTPGPDMDTYANLRHKLFNHEFIGSQNTNPEHRKLYAQINDRNDIQPNRLSQLGNFLNNAKDIKENKMPLAFGLHSIDAVRTYEKYRKGHTMTEALSMLKRIDPKAAKVVGKMIEKGIIVADNNNYGKYGNYA